MILVSLKTTYFLSFIFISFSDEQFSINVYWVNRWHLLMEENDIWIKPLLQLLTAGNTLLNGKGEPVSTHIPTFYLPGLQDILIYIKK